MFPEPAALLDERGRVLEANGRFANLLHAVGRKPPEAGDSYVDLLRNTLGVIPQQAERIEDKLTYLAIEDAPGLAFVREVECNIDGQHRYHRIQMVQWNTRRERRLLVMHVDVTSARLVERRAELELELCRALSHTDGAFPGYLRAARVFGTHIGALGLIHLPIDSRGRPGEPSCIQGTGFAPKRRPLAVVSEPDSLAHRAAAGRAPVLSAPGPTERELAYELGLDPEALSCCAVPSVRQGRIEDVVLFFMPRDDARQRENVALFAGLLGVELSEDLPTSRSPSGAPPASTDFDAMASLASDTDAPVLLLGESGVGKTRLSRVIHQRSRRRSGPFLDLNCAGLAPELLESELFGHERGAFTGAHARKLGLLEKASGGTVLLDEVGELDLSVQSKLLKVIETRTFRRLGGSQEIESDVRFIAATHRDLWARVQQGAFREDLLYRLNVVQIAVPPLRDTPWRIPSLARELLVELGAREGKELTLSPGAELLLMQQRWRGNIRELGNVLARASLGASRTIDERRIHFAVGSSAPSGGAEDEKAGIAKLEDTERGAIVRALEAAGFNVKRTAEALGIARSTLYDKISRYGIDVREGRRRMRERESAEPGGRAL